MPLHTVEPLRLYRQIAGQIAALIDNGEFPAGSRLPAERELATLLGVSRTSVREAIISLEIAGRVEVRVGSGIFVAEPGAAQIVGLVDEGPSPFELLAARRLIEGEIAALAARLRQEGRHRLAARDGRAHARVSPTISRKRDAADREFHVRIAAATGNGSLALVVEGLWQQRARQAVVAHRGVLPYQEDPRGHAARPRGDHRRARAARRRRRARRPCTGISRASSASSSGNGTSSSRASRTRAARAAPPGPRKRTRDVAVQRDGRSIAMTVPVSQAIAPASARAPCNAWRGRRSAEAAPATPSVPVTARDERAPVRRRRRPRTPRRARARKRPAAGFTAAPGKRSTLPLSPSDARRRPAARRARPPELRRHRNPNRRSRMKSAFSIDAVRTPRRGHGDRRRRVRSGWSASGARSRRRPRAR